MTRENIQRNESNEAGLLRSPKQVRLTDADHLKLRVMAAERNRSLTQMMADIFAAGVAALIAPTKERSKGSKAK